jgi:hypothetical protein
MKMEVKYSSDMSVGFQRTIRHYIPENRTEVSLTVKINYVLKTDDSFIGILLTYLLMELSAS